MDLNNETFLVTCNNDQDYLTALTGGPWVILDHYLLVHPWSPNFRTSDKPHRSVVAWVQFPELPVHFYHREVLFAIGNLIGRTIKLDYHTETLQRGKFARMAIDLDMTKPLPTRIHLDGKWQGVVYENLPHICYGCGKIGHVEDSCPAREKSSELALVIAADGSGKSVEGSSPPEAPAGYGPWMQVTRRSRKSTKAKSGNPPISSPSSGADSGKTAPKSGTKGKTELEMKGKKESKEVQRKETHTSQKGKAIMTEASGPNGKKKGVVIQEWREVGSSEAGSSMGRSMEAQPADMDQTNKPTSTTISAKALQGPNNTKIQIISVPPLLSSCKENQNPNLNRKLSTQRSQKKNPEKMLSAIQNRGISLKSTKKPLQLNSIARDVLKKSKDGSFPITIKDIEELFASSNTKVSAPQTLAAEKMNEVVVEEDHQGNSLKSSVDAFINHGTPAAISQSNPTALNGNPA
ncbi:unnamed protein product [Linum trigynum]|uniref:CCHC-type domain-containing protein n=1 Tax=Linum trigynum TaxID=586398 RepID=A0AAV2GLY9_9ROSI